MFGIIQFTMSCMIKNARFVMGIIFFCFCEFVAHYFSKDKQLFFRNLCEKLSKKNILFVKMFQAIALNNGLISEETNTELLKYADDAPWSYDDIDWDTIYSLQSNDNICFNYGHQPINSGMISLVFRGYHKVMKQNVIIKMKKKYIEAQLDEAINEVRFLLILLSVVPMFKSFELGQVVSKNLLSIKQQTNFYDEIANTNLMKNNCKQLKYVKIPEIYEEYTKIYSNIIVMEFIEGVKINQVNKSDYNEFAKIIMKYTFFTLLIHGAVHGDLHAGNVLFIKNEDDPQNQHQIGVIDFGVLCKFDDDFKQSLFDMFSDMLIVPKREIALKIINSNVFEPKEALLSLPEHKLDGLIDILEEIITDTLQKQHGATQFKIYDAIFNLNAFLKKNNLLNKQLKLSDNFVKMQMSMAMAHGVTLKLCDTSDCVDISNQVFNDMFHVQLLLSNN
jgi:predicted unusual protein kinase regulating ubiquinone biosynthesis (AarF/ABC1/UbiB family)